MLFAVKRSRGRRWARIADAATWPAVLRRYLLATRTNLPISDSDIAEKDDIAALSTDEVAVKAALMLGVEHWWALPAELHVRLLHVLTDDVVQSGAMRLEMATRLDALTNLAVRPDL
jgi:hypothetical protein